MALLKQIFNFYINCSIHVALSVYALTWITLIELGINYNESVLYFVFYGAITGYNFVKYFGIARFRHRKLANWLRYIQILSFICFVLMCYYALQLSFKTYVFIGCFTLLTVLYAIPLYPKRKQTLRNVSGLKIYVIALVWTGVTVFIPVINSNIEVSTDVVIIAIQRFLYVLVLMLPFEIRDLKFDNLKLFTIPQILGVRKTKMLGVLFLLTIFVLEFFKDEISETSILIVFLMAIITGLFLVFSRIEQPKYYSAFWVEGLPVLWLILVLIFN